MSWFPKIKCLEGSSQGDTVCRKKFNDEVKGEKLCRDVIKLTYKNQQLINFYNAQKRNKDPLLLGVWQQCPLLFHQWVKVASVAYTEVTLSP